MPLSRTSIYRPPIVFRNRHLATMYPSIWRQVEISYQRRRIVTPDHDFIDLDWSAFGGKKLLLALHGLEGSSDSQYIRGIIRIFNDHGWDGVAMNFRSCSGEMNHRRRLYHSGETTDLDFVINTIADQYDYEEIVLVGYSLGGNVALKYGGEKGKDLHPIISKIVGVSVPMDLQACNLEIQKWNNFLYLRCFMNSLKRKFKAKQHLYPDIDPRKVLSAKNFSDFDEAFTAPVHGFKDAVDYWTNSSSLRYLPDMAVPALIINALDDSFLSESSYPYKLAARHPKLNLLAPDFGGHVGFPQSHPRGYYWAEERIVDFVLSK